MNAPEAELRADVAIVAVLEDTYLTVCRLLDLQTTWRMGQEWAVGAVETIWGDELLVLCGMPVDRSNNPTQAFTSILLRAWLPSAVVVADVGGGLRREGNEPLQLGDVIAAQDLHYSSFVKERPGGIVDRREFGHKPISERLRQAVNMVRFHDEDWHARVALPRTAPGVPRLLPGQAASRVVPTA